MIRTVLLALCMAVGSVQAAIGADLTDFRGDPIVTPADKRLHLVFFNMWQSYEGNGAEALMEKLPADYMTDTQVVWVQLNINVTDQYLAGFQDDYPLVKPLMLDRDFSMARQYRVWATPTHVVLDKGKVVFKGSNARLKQFISQSAPN